MKKDIFKGPATIFKEEGLEEFLDQDGFDIFFLRDLMDMVPDKSDKITTIPILPVVLTVVNTKENKSNTIKRLKETAKVYSEFFNKQNEEVVDVICPKIQTGDDLVELDLDRLPTLLINQIAEVLKDKDLPINIWKENSKLDFLPVSVDLRAGVRFALGEGESGKPTGMFSIVVSTKRKVKEYGYAMVGLYGGYDLETRRPIELGINLPGIWSISGYKLYSLEDRIVGIKLVKPLEEYHESIQQAFKIFEESKYWTNFIEFCKASQMPKEEVLTKLIGKMEG